jgi:hypothetical protein
MAEGSRRSHGAEIRVFLLLALGQAAVIGLIIALVFINIIDSSHQHAASARTDSEILRVVDQYEGLAKDNKASLTILQTEFGKVAKQEGLAAAVAELTCIYNRVDYDTGKAKLIPGCSISYLVKKYGHPSS